MRVRAMIWFLVQSWQYLGCNRGTGRWSARLRYIREVRRAARTFRAAVKADRL